MLCERLQDVLCGVGGSMAIITLLRISVGDRCAKTQITGLRAILSDLR